MAFSIQRAVSDGTMTLLPISIEYFDREEISVAFDGVLNARQWAWVGTTDKTLSFTPAVADTVEVVVVRSTDLSELRHQFSLGAQFTAESLDESLLQVLHIAQEATERQLGGDFFTHIDMHGSQITNLGAATAPDHAVTLAQYQADASGASAAKDTAVASASTAVASSNSASASASAALLSANNAGVSEFNALSSANSVSASASTASTKAAEAAASAAAALVSENAAELAESNAKASEVAAAASAAAALHPWEAEAGGIHYDLGNVRIGGVGKRITGDFSNATIADSVMFQTSTVNGETNFGVIPNGASPYSLVSAYNSSTPGNSAAMRMGVNGTVAYFDSTKYGTGTYLPMTFYTGGSERMRIDASGNVGVGATPGSERLRVSGAASAPTVLLTGKSNTSTGSDLYILRSSTSDTISQAPNIYFDGTTKQWTLQSGSSGFQFFGYNYGWTERLRLTTAGDVLSLSPNGGLGYGTGAGGVVTQATSKTTTVTLNKPTGQITMNAAALAVNARVVFNVNNNLVTADDIVVATYVYDFGTAYRVDVQAVWNGYFQIGLTNVTTGSLSQAVRINFAIIKGASS